MPPTVNVSVSYPGASAETIAATVLAPLEVNINGVENMLYMTSTAASGSGSGSINVYFSLGTNPDMALVNVNNKVNLAQTLLPEEVRRQGVTVVKRSPAMLQAFAYYSPTAATTRSISTTGCRSTWWTSSSACPAWATVPCSVP